MNAVRVMQVTHVARVILYVYVRICACVHVCRYPFICLSIRARTRVSVAHLLGDRLCYQQYVYFQRNVVVVVVVVVIIIIIISLCIMHNH